MPHTTSVEIAIITYDGAGRVPHLLTSLRPSRHAVQRVTVYEDPSYPHVSPQIMELCASHEVAYQKAPQWSNMQGMAWIVLAQTQAQWLILLSDDVILSPDCVPHLVRRCQLAQEWLSAFNVPSWQATELFPDDREQMYTRSQYEIPPVDAEPSLYINVHGSGFVVRTAHWRAVGGPPQHTWCYDEDLGAKIWLLSPWGIGRVGGPAMVHYGGGAQNGRLHPDHDAHTLAAWARDWDGVEDKGTLATLMRRAMAVKSALWNVPVG